MSTIDKASLIQIPSGYKNGKLYSVKPTPTYGSEEVTNGDFATDSDWTKGTGWSISGGKANCDGSQTSTSSLYQNAGLTIGAKYKVIVTISNYSVGNIRILMGGSTFGEWVNGNGEKTFILVQSFDQRIYVQADANFSGSIDNVSVKEITNIGDFTFSRSSSGTRVNSEGLIEVAKVIGTTEEVIDGDFSSGAHWNGSASVSSGQLTKTSGGLAYQSGVVTANKYYKVVVDVASLDGATTLYFGGNQYTLSVGVQTLELVGGTGNTFVGFNNGYSSGSGSVFNSISVIEYIENDVPRLDYSDGASCASLLLEGQRTNIETKSTDINGWSLASNVTRTANYITSPDGTSNATRLQFTSSGFLGNTFQVSGTEYTVSCYAKRNDTNTQSFGFFTNGSGAVNSAMSLTSDWKRFEFTYTSTNSSYVGLAGSSGADVSVFGFQVEVGSFSTSLIYTSGATATRTADICNNAGTSATFNSTEGVLFAEIAALTEVGDGTTRLSISDGSQDNNITIGYSATNTLRTIIRSGASNQALMTSSQTIANYLKVAVKYKINDFALWVNGVEVATDTSGLAPVGLSELAFDRGDGALDFYGKTKQLMTFNEALSDEELSDLTGQVNLSFNNLATFYGYTIL